MDRHSGLGGCKLCLFETTAETSPGHTNAPCSLHGADWHFELGVQGLELLCSSGLMDWASHVLSTLDSFHEDLGSGGGRDGEELRPSKEAN